ncbi:hypothetical protein NLJ89_g1738 [Agrocybe chaxingu]|uniref:Uncharacterized protein n=1 Tax=Agrocybe chaxingu TaxID=84603 RepID=A0A9W8MZH2_9AGAR|nr:hypothetical protein NLJ89_g1738 [Agrocybe chaxingu]
MSASMDQLTPSQSPHSEDAHINHQLESLEIDRPDTNHVVLLLGSTDSSAQAKLPRLRSLTATLYFFEEEYNMIAPFLSQAEETLEYFKITYGDLPPPPMVDLGTMKRLKHLELDSHELGVGTVLRDYTLLLDVLTAPASLETLDLHFALSLYNKDHYTALAPLFQSLGAPSDSNVWTALNDILSAPFRFVGLRRLAIHVHLLHYPVPRPIPDARFRDLITTLIFFALPYFSGADGVRELVVDFTT